MNECTPHDWLHVLNTTCEQFARGTTSLSRKATTFHNSNKNWVSEDDIEAASRSFSRQSIQLVLLRGRASDGAAWWRIANSPSWNRKRNQEISVAISSLSSQCRHDSHVRHVAGAKSEPQFSRDCVWLSDVLHDNFCQTHRDNFWPTKRRKDPVEVQSSVSPTSSTGRDGVFERKNRATVERVASFGSGCTTLPCPALRAAASIGTSAKRNLRGASTEAVGSTHRDGPSGSGWFSHIEFVLWSCQRQPKHDDRVLLGV